MRYGLGVAASRAHGSDRAIELQRRKGFLDMRLGHGVVIGACLLLCLAAAGQETGCGQTEAFASDAWKTIGPPAQPVEVMYADRSGWIGVGHISMLRQEVAHRSAAILPWVVPQVRQVFLSALSVDNIRNTTPTLYVHWNAFYYAMTPDNLARLHIVRMSHSGDERYVVTLKGRTSLTMKPGFRPQDEVAFASRFLGENLLEITVKKPLHDGQYMVFLSDAGGDGFEFGISCARP